MTIKTLGGLAAATLLILCAAPLGAQTPTAAPLGAFTQWEKAEFRLDGVPSAANNFDPEQIAVDATLTSPSGATQVVPAFWFQDYTRDSASRSESLKAVGEPSWRLRYTPTESGTYRLAVRWRVAGADAPGAIETSFEVAPGRDPSRAGWVRVAPDRRFFETSDGRPLHLVGENVCWPESGGIADFDRWFERMAGAGENYARIWLCPWWAGLEHKPGTLNRYPLDEAWRLDHVFEEADLRGIYLLLSLDHHGMYQVDNKSWGGHNNFWATNPYSKVQGGPCEAPNDFFTSLDARAIYEKRLRYLVARYGYSQRLLAWQFFNEIDNVFERGLNGADVIAWHRELGRWLKAHDPYGHLVTTSLTGNSDRPEMWSIPEMDFSDYHSYWEPAPGKRLAALSEDFVHRYGKPVLIDEFGVSAASWKLDTDPYLRGFRQALWSSALGGSVGTAMPWWWEDMDRDNVYTLYSALSRVLDGAGWQQGRWEPARVVSPGSTPTELGPENPDAEVFDASLALTGAGRRLRLSGLAAIASPLAAERSSEELSRYLYGSRYPELSHADTIVASFAKGGRVSVRVSASASENDIVIRVAGSQVARMHLAKAAPHDGAPAEPAGELTAEVPEGRQEIEIANLGEDQITLDSVRLQRVRAVGFKDGWNFEPEVAALESGAKAVVYVTSPWVVYPAGALRYNPAMLRGKSVTLLSWPDGPVEARWFSTLDGSQREVTRARAVGGTVSVPIPPFNEDIVGVVQSAPGAGAR
jgi:hypothetical protein